MQLKTSTVSSLFALAAPKLDYHFGMVCAFGQQSYHLFLLFRVGFQDAQILQLYVAWKIYLAERAFKGFIGEQIFLVNNILAFLGGPQHECPHGSSRGSLTSSEQFGHWLGLLSQDSDDADELKSDIALFNI